MSAIRCDNVSEGMRESEAVASFVDYHGQFHYIRVERDFLLTIHGCDYLPVGVVQYHEPSKSYLVELPHEAETGANRLWVKEEQLDHKEVFV